MEVCGVHVSKCQYDTFCVHLLNRIGKRVRDDTFRMGWIIFMSHVHAVNMHTMANSVSFQFSRFRLLFLMILSKPLLQTIIIIVTTNVKYIHVVRTVRKFSLTNVNNNYIIIQMTIHEVMKWRRWDGETGAGGIGAIMVKEFSINIARISWWSWGVCARKARVAAPNGMLRLILYTLITM